jgi:glycerol-3-phosphate acyltransferase PlsY
MAIIKLTACGVIAYLLGCFNAAYLYSMKIRKDDIRKYGSGNAGSTNVLRVYGTSAALAVFACDVAKGVLAVWIARGVFGGGSLMQVVAAVCVVCGHNWPVFMHYRGGKGVAASLGALSALFVWGGVAGLIVALPVMLLTKLVSLGSLCGFTALSLTFLFFSGDMTLFAGSAVLWAMTVYQHRENIRRILNGTESKISFSKKGTDEG